MENGLGNFFCTITTTDFKPLPGAAATLGTEPPQTAVANESGQLRLYDLRAGNYALDVALDGYGPLHHSVRINAGRDTILELHLTPV